ncbi:hypothetical protein TR51_14945 [Kitasatospora griseola]|uniref:Uncharacterized protein n=1 Tax=Kitasatospora griseola TaxID=2064 RepID=A0A0D0PY78_KITGR|nr:hypothetical protein [Kitasatospora griseola]KIQ65247.1 hypothetical protein TR51_14945 [Kitasatospora griseola]
MDPVERAGRTEHVARIDRIDRIENGESGESGEHIERTGRDGGEPACWLNLVCEECGKVREGGRCPVCPAEPAGPSVAVDSGS